MPNQIVSRAYAPSQRAADTRARTVSRHAVVGLRLAAAGAASLAIAATGATASPLIPIGVAIAAVCGLQGGIVAGAICGALVVTASLPHLAGETGAGFQALNHAATWAVLFPLTGTTAGLVHALRARPDASGERRRLAADLHDGVAQTLAHLRLELDMLAHPDLGRVSDPERLARLARVADRTLTDVRALISDLAAPMPPGGLPDALREHVHAVQGSLGPSITLDAPEPTRAGALVEGQLLRIAQEAISNAVRHSGGTAVHVRLAPDPDGATRMTIDDDGCGLAPGAARDGGLGLDTMRERAHAIGATIAIGVREGGGTRVEVLAPATRMSRTA